MAGLIKQSIQARIGLLGTLSNRCHIFLERRPYCKPILDYDNLFMVQSRHYIKSNQKVMHMEGSASDAQVLIDLDRWHDRFQTSHVPALNTFYDHSPEYDELWTAIWSEYDTLTAQQRPSSRLSWQQNVEDIRSGEDTVRASSYRPMGEDLWHLCPLSVHLDRYTGVSSQDRIHPWSATWANWHRFRETYHRELRGDEDSRCTSAKSLRDSLSDAQKSSFEILEDWWCSCYAPNILADSVRRCIQNRLKSTDFDPISLLRTPTSMADRSHYHSYCILLFIHEFNPQSWEPYRSYDYLNNLQRIRHMSLLNAIAQRLAYTTIKHDRLQLRSKYPQVFVNSDSRQVSRRDSGYPYYLWDSVTKVTFTVPQTFSHEYTCISHTWGRWRLPSFTRVPGVPWDVPQNSLYNVRDLPQMLEGLGARYIWFDLFCIPQDGSKLGDVEISRQSTIFQGSTNCIAWFHDVESWEGVQASLDWIGVKYLSTTTKFTDDNSISRDTLQHAWDTANTPAELMCLSPTKPAETQDAYDQQADLLPVAWFSSLWTLQETVLCPEMELYSKNWVRLNDRSGHALRLSTLVALLSMSLHYIPLDGPVDTSIADPVNYSAALTSERPKLEFQDMRIPLGPSNLVRLLTHTQLDAVLFSRCPARVFINSNIRHCTGSRAPAIMSAVGVTDWFTKRLDQKTSGRSRSDSLLFGTYPLAFIEEAFQKFGAPFLDGTLGVEKRLSVSQLIRPKPVGSMLPLSSDESRFTDRTPRVDRMRIEIVDHPSIASWRIKANGSLEVGSVGMWSSSKDITAPQNLEAVLGWQNLDRHYTNHTTHLQEKLGEIAGDDDIVYAIMLYKDYSEQHGVLLQSPRVKRFGRRYLVKIGFLTVFDQVEMPACTKVNWVIL